MKTPAISEDVLAIYRKLRAKPVSMLVGFSAAGALSDARTIAEFAELEAEGLVRIETEEETENYFDVYGREYSERDNKRMEEILERWGCVCVASEYLDERGEWQSADSIGMCVYENPASPFENCYVVGLMRSALAQAQKVKAEPAERSFWEARDVVTV